MSGAHRPAPPSRTALRARAATRARRIRIAVGAALLALLVMVGGPVISWASGGGSDIYAACRAQLAAPGLSSSARTWLHGCTSAFATPVVTTPTTTSLAPSASPTTTVAPSPTSTTQPPTAPPTATTTAAPSPSVSPSPTPTTPSPTATTPSPSPTPTPTPTPTTTTTGPILATCPAYPAMPDASCTGWQHTGVTLHACSLPLVAGVTYDACDFTGEVNVSAANITVTRSRFRGAVVYRTADGGSLRGLTLTDVEIDSSSALGTSSIGNNDWTCIRCNVHGGTRGANPGHNAVLRDSWLHGWTSRSGDHITGVGSNGGSDNVIDHNRISCDILNDSTGFACSSGLSVYGDDAPGNSRWTITNNLINSGSSYCVIIAGPPAKPNPFDHMLFAGNVFGADGAIARGLAPDRCTEFGPVATQPESWGTQAAPVNGNAWYGNVTLSGSAVTP